MIRALLPATLTERLGIERATDQLIELGDRPGAAHPGRKLLAWSTPVAGGTASTTWTWALRIHPGGAWLSGNGRLRRGDLTSRLHLRPVRQLDRICGELLARVWTGAGPRTVDLHSAICAVYDIHK
jgi:hypothetical protein